MPNPQRRLALIGQHFGQLRVEAFAGRSERRQALWRCRCACGAERVVDTAALRRGRATSCGCGKSAKCRAAAETHRHAIERTPEYLAWGNMIQRCTNPNHPSWPRYGARGISVCARWLESFEAFLADMGPRPSPAYSLDRRENDGDYEPSNCRWATDEEQLLNTRRNRRLTIAGETLHVSQWAQRLGIPSGTLSSRAARWESASAPPSAA